MFLNFVVLVLEIWNIVIVFEDVVHDVYVHLEPLRELFCSGHCLSTFDLFSSFIKNVFDLDSLQFAL